METLQIVTAFKKSSIRCSGCKRGRFAELGEHEGRKKTKKKMDAENEGAKATLTGLVFCPVRVCKKDKDNFDGKN